MSELSQPSFTRLIRFMKASAFLPEGFAGGFAAVDAERFRRNTDRNVRADCPVRGFVGGVMTGHWLVKSEPEAFSWDQQVANRVEPWTGVRNHTAKNNLKAMRKGDLAFFYHSGVGKQIVGVVEVVREAYPDPTAETGDWVCVDMKAVRPLPKPVTLVDIKADPNLTDMPLVRQSRLSVMPVAKPHWDKLCRMGGWKI
jgi:predicted RNA-binding protein with PUA-like domain